MPVNEERVQLLADALRSGEFAQGLNMLRTNDDEYCCLGVACEIARRCGIGIEWKHVKDCNCEIEECEGRWHFGGSGTGLVATVSDWYGFTDGLYDDPSDPTLVESDAAENTSMMKANDELGWTFDQIADALEATYLNKTGAPE